MKVSYNISPLHWTLAALLAAASPAVAQESLAIKGGRILTMTETVIEDGVILVRDGKITAIGKDLDIPIEAEVIDATGKTIMPGFVEAHSSEAMSQSNETNSNVPYLSVLDAIDPMRPYFDEARRNGVTTVAVVPGNDTMIGGQAAVIKTGGTFIDSMVLKAHAGIKLSLDPPARQSGGRGFRRGSPFPTPAASTSPPSRMGHLATLRHELEKARKEVEGSEASEGDDEDEEEDSGRSRTPSTDKELRTAMHRLVKGETPAFIYCKDAMDVGHALDLYEEFDLNPILVLGKDCYRAAEQVARSRLHAILDPSLVFWESDERTGKDKKIIVTEEFRNAGVPFTFQVASSRSNTQGNNFLWYQAATAVKYGMPAGDALEALTILPAKILGVDRFVGSLEKGKDADIVILTGDPLAVNTWVDTTIVNGEVVYERRQDSKLKRLLEGSDSK